jgi:hypothetical protein
MLTRKRVLLDNGRDETFAGLLPCPNLVGQIGHFNNKFKVLGKSNIENKADLSRAADTLTVDGQSQMRQISFCFIRNSHLWSARINICHYAP